MYHIAPSYKRVLSYILDLVICLFAGIAISLTLEIFHVEFNSAIWFALFVFSDCFNGQSIGKRLFKIKVVNFKTQKPTNIFIGIIRNLIGLLNFSLITVAINAILFTSYYRTLADLLTNTCVIECNPKSPTNQG